MAYTKNTWTDGDIVTSEKLNHMEDGVAGAYKMMNVGNVTLFAGTINGTLDKTWQEIFDAVSAGNICYFIGTDQYDEYSKKMLIIINVYVYRTEGEDPIYMISTTEEYELGAGSPTQRPTAGGGDGPS